MDPFFAIFISQSGDDYKTELYAESWDEAIRESKSAFGEYLRAVQQVNVADGGVIREFLVPVDY